MKIEGTFILRYRVFDIFSKVQGSSDLVVQAECYGGPFRVYSTKEFPGLQASTELTKVSSLFVGSCICDSDLVSPSNLHGGVYVLIFERQSEDVERDAHQVLRMLLHAKPTKSSIKLIVTTTIDGRDSYMDLQAGRCLGTQCLFIPSRLFG